MVSRKTKKVIAQYDYSYLNDIFEYTQDLTSCFFVSKEWYSTILRIFPTLIKPRLSFTQLDSIHLVKYNKLRAIATAAARKCAICKNKFIGGFSIFGFPAHRKCILSKCKTHKRIQDSEIRGYVWKHLPVLEHEYQEFVWFEETTLLPPELTYQGYIRTHRQEVDDFIFSKKEEREEKARADRERVLMGKEEVRSGMAESHRRQLQWDKDFVEICAREKTSFKTVRGMKTKVGHGIYGISHPTPRRAFDRAKLVVDNLGRIPEEMRHNQIWTWIWEGDKEEATRFWFVLENSELLAKFRFRGVSGSIQNAMEYVRRLKIINWEEDDEKFRMLVDHYNPYQLLKRYDRVMELLGEDAYDRYGKRCFYVSEFVKDVQEEIERLCQCGNRNKKGCPSLKCAWCCDCDAHQQ
jgi:hypothetical protein